ncbi:MAG: hypothetical protein O3B84_08575, partial [Chloroflexi bacterium]|nr:hypothetical protein [Chloroflexota bacterium]
MKLGRHVLFAPTWSTPHIDVRTVLVAAVVGLAVTWLLPGTLAAQRGRDTGNRETEWRWFGADIGATRYSPAA